METTQLQLPSPLSCTLVIDIYSCHCHVPLPCTLVMYPCPVPVRARDLVLLAGGAAAFAAALVLDRVCWAGAVGSGSIGAVMRRLRLVGVLVATGNWAVVLTFLGACCGPGVGTTLGAAVGTSVDMDLVIRMFGGGVSLSTLGAGCTLGIAGCCGLSESSASSAPGGCPCSHW